MKNPKEGDRVRVLTGKRQGQIGKITSVDKDRALVQLPDVPYECSYLHSELEWAGRVEEPAATDGEARRRQMAKLVREKKLCPSYPHACAGTCGVE